jgi:lipid-binding SYLF domain-containing protein
MIRRTWLWSGNGVSAWSPGLDGIGVGEYHPAPPEGIVTAPCRPNGAEQERPMFTNPRTLLAASVALAMFAVAPVSAGEREVKTVEAAAAIVHEFGVPLHHIPPQFLRDATGIAVVPHIVKAGVVFDARFGRGVVLVHQPDGSWSNPIFVKLEGFGVGGEAGIESTDLVLVFKTRTGLDHMLNGREKLTLGTDAAVAAGPIGKEAEVAVRGRKVEIFSYSRSRGLFAGVSVEGAGLKIDREANESFYGIRGGHPAEVIAHRGIPAAEGVRTEVSRLIAPPPPPPPPPLPPGGIR